MGKRCGAAGDYAIDDSAETGTARCMPPWRRPFPFPPIPCVLLLPTLLLCLPHFLPHLLPLFRCNPTPLPPHRLPRIEQTLLLGDGRLANFARQCQPGLPSAPRPGRPTLAYSVAPLLPRPFASVATESPTRARSLPPTQGYSSGVYSTTWIPNLASANGAACVARTRAALAVACRNVRGGVSPSQFAAALNVVRPNVSCGQW